MSIPFAELQKLDPSADLVFIILDCTALGGSTYYLSPGVNVLGLPMVWQGQTYTPFPIEMEGFEWSSKGTLPRPKLRIAALDGFIGGLIHTLDDLVGARVTLKRTFLRFIDSDNFPAPGDLGWGLSPWGDGPWGGVTANPYADPTACYPDEPWIIERKTAETSDVIEFELATPLDQPNAQVPKRRITANVCGWNNLSICPFSEGGLCAKTLQACRDHAATDGLYLTEFLGGLPFGAFAGTARVR